MPVLHGDGIATWATFASHVSLCGRMGYALPFTYRITHRGLEVTMAKGQMRSNKEKKKPKQDKNKKKGAEASVKLGTSYASQYGKKH
jgi:hypothetical protein